jgi:hypothetical protein
LNFIGFGNGAYDARYGFGNILPGQGFIAMRSLQKQNYL